MNEQYVFYHGFFILLLRFMILRSVQGSFKHCVNTLGLVLVHGSQDVCVFTCKTIGRARPHAPARYDATNDAATNDATTDDGATNDAATDATTAPHYSTSMYV